jgi:hypothetical protein
MRHCSLLVILVLCTYLLVQISGLKLHSHKNLAKVKSNYIVTCHDMVLDGKILRGICQAANGLWRPAAPLDLDTVLGVDKDGQLIYKPNGVYNSKCSNCHLLNQRNLVCKCQKDCGDLVDASLDLNQIIDNTDSNLIYKLTPVFS